MIAADTLWVLEQRAVLASCVAVNSSWCDAEQIMTAGSCLGSDHVTLLVAAKVMFDRLLRCDVLACRK
jgi:hypothetical protein